MTTRVDRSRLPVPGPNPPFRFPEMAHQTLANGLRVRTIEHPGVPVVTFVIQIDGGLGADPTGREGLAAITADMLDEGTGSLSAIDVSDALARIGGEYDVEVGADATIITLTTLARFAARGADLLAEMLSAPSMHGADFERIRQLRLDRLRQLADLPSAVAERAFLRLLYPTHPYGHLAIGTEGALRAVTRDEVVQFHAGTFLPSRATLGAVGALSHIELVTIVEHAFGGWTGERDVVASPRQAVDVAVDVETSPRLALIPRDGAAQSELRLGHLSARRDTPDYPALLVMNAILGGQFVSRLNLKLREEKAFTYGVRTGFDWRRGIGPFAVQTSVHTAATAESISDALTEMSDLRGRRPATAEELSVAQASLTRGYPRNFETAQQVARSIAQLALFNLPDSYFEQFVPKVNAVTVDEVTRVAARYLDPGRAIALVVGDRQATEDSLMRLDFAEMHVLPPGGQ